MLRVKSTRVYSLLRESKQKIVGKYFIVVYMFDEAIAESAAGITVSKKVGNAVVRNKVKRRIKAVLNGYTVGSRELAPTVLTSPLPSPKGEGVGQCFYCNIIALSSAVDAEWIAFKGELEKSLRQLLVVRC
jgi:hypothetical protein